MSVDPDDSILWVLGQCGTQVKILSENTKKIKSKENMEFFCLKPPVLKLCYEKVAIEKAIYFIFKFCRETRSIDNRL